ncbi:MAG TPA: hypothetical protein VM221_04120 [Armatimonadota bacterium]|nr:hypothetical protein [Armatimonadota bacterium]
MPRDLISDVTLSAMEKVLDSTAAPQRVIAHNIGNVDTPGFTRRDVSFDDQLARHLPAFKVKPAGDEEPIIAAEIPETRPIAEHASRSLAQPTSQPPLPDLSSADPAGLAKIVRGLIREEQE